MDEHGLTQHIEQAIAELDRKIAETEERLAALKRQRKSFRKGLKAIAAPLESNKP